MIFQNRTRAGHELAKGLTHFKDPDLVVLALPRGGLPVANEVAKELNAPLDVIVVRKLGVPFQPELAMGALGEGDVLVRNEDVIRSAGISAADFEAVRSSESDEVISRAKKFRNGRPAIPLKNRIALIIDDGIATGSTALAACKVVRAKGARKIVVAVPTASAEAVALLRSEADDVVSLDIPTDFFAVGQWYEDFSPVTDEEVIELLASRQR